MFIFIELVTHAWSITRWSIRPSKHRIARSASVDLWLLLANEKQDANINKLNMLKHVQRMTTDDATGLSGDFCINTTHPFGCITCELILKIPNTDDVQCNANGFFSLVNLCSKWEFSSQASSLISDTAHSSSQSSAQHTHKKVSLFYAATWHDSHEMSSGCTWQMWNEVPWLGHRKRSTTSGSASWNGFIFPFDFDPMVGWTQSPNLPYVNFECVLASHKTNTL